MNKRPLYVAVAVAMALMLGVWFHNEHGVVLGQSLSHSVPRSWGTCKGGVTGGLIFEDTEGTVRIVNLVTWNVDFLITRQ
jgi:hypothetical protein